MRFIFVEDPLLSERSKDSLLTLFNVSHPIESPLVSEVSEIFEWYNYLSVEEKELFRDSGILEIDSLIVNFQKAFEKKDHIILTNAEVINVKSFRTYNFHIGKWLPEIEEVSKG